MKRQIATYFFTLLATLLVSCTDAGTEPPKIVFQNVEGHENLFVPEAGTIVIRDNSTWLRYWRDYRKCYSDTGKEPPPTIDFNKVMVVAVFYGAKYIGCFNSEREDKYCCLTQIYDPETCYLESSTYTGNQRWV